MVAIRFSWPVASLPRSDTVFCWPSHGSRGGSHRRTVGCKPIFAPGGKRSRLSFHGRGQRHSGLARTIFAVDFLVQRLQGHHIGDSRRELVLADRARQFPRSSDAEPGGKSAYPVARSTGKFGCSTLDARASCSPFMRGIEKSVMSRSPASPLCKMSSTWAGVMTSKTIRPRSSTISAVLIRMSGSCQPQGPSIGRDASGSAL